jgi:hypothetical protein
MANDEIKWQTEKPTSSLAEESMGRDSTVVVSDLVALNIRSRIGSPNMNTGARINEYHVLRNAPATGTVRAACVSQVPNPTASQNTTLQNATSQNTTSQNTTSQHSTPYHFTAHHIPSSHKISTVSELQHAR